VGADDGLFEFLIDHAVLGSAPAPTTGHPAIGRGEVPAPEPDRVMLHPTYPLFTERLVLRPFATTTSMPSMTSRAA
jgi:hypothetical protein